jgi:lactoylglutathione lyase
MSPIVHLSLKVAEVQGTGDFYQQMFGFRDAETKRTRDHVSRHMSDGAIDFTLMQYDADTQSAESKAAGDGPCIHHFALEVEDVAKTTQLVKANGCEIISDPGVMPVKFRAVGGVVAELVAVGRYPKPVIDRKICRIVHIAVKVDDVKASGDFYHRVFGFEDVVMEHTRRHIARHMTDGRIDFSLIRCNASAAAGDPPCIHHFALEVEDVEGAAAQLESYGCKIISDPGAIPVKFEAPGGTLAELVPIGRYQRRIS